MVINNRIHRLNRLPKEDRCKKCNNKENSKILMTISNHHQQLGEILEMAIFNITFKMIYK